MSFTNVRLLAAVAGFALPCLSQAEITGSAHDFSQQGWNPTNQLCVVCHAPHFGAHWEEGVLWNHELSTQVYTLYDNNFSNTIDGTVTQPQGISKLCLGCHDGTVALNQFGDNIGAAPQPSLDVSASFAVVANGNDLRATHPISITYNNTDDPELHDPTTPIASGTNVALTVSDLLFGNPQTVECSSCHDVHNGPEAIGHDALLRVAEDGSAICFACHNK